jgi:biotin carboxylase
MLPNTTRSAVIVDPYSSGAFLGPAFRRQGVAPIALLTSPEPPAVYTGSWKPSDYDCVLIHDQPITQLISRIRSYDPICIIPGAECGVELADTLALTLTPHLANRAEYASARRHKARMAEAVAAAGLPAIRQICTNQAAAVADWIRREELSHAALILKPPKSAGTDGVVKIAPSQNWRPAFERLLGQQNKLGLINDEVLVQEFVTGEEYVIDTFSHNGVHSITDICRYHKVVQADQIALYDRMEFLPYDRTTYADLIDYTNNVLDALGIQTGSAHTEIMRTAAGPRLIETGARMHGGGHPAFCQLATGSSQLDRSMRFYSGAGAIPPDFHLIQNVMIVFLIASRSGTIRNADTLGAAATFASHHASVVAVKNGDPVVKTSDLFSALGFIALAHEQREQIYADYHAIKAIERALIIE